MTLLIKHRINTINNLKKTDKKYGLEIDIRSWGQKLILSHDPFKAGTNFEKWLSYYNHSFLILNTKEEGLEKKVLSLMNKFKIKNFFFLDQSFPFLLKTCLAGESRTAVRYSEFESIETVKKLKCLVQWVWVDTFTKFPLTKKNYIYLKKNNFKLCLVSPELIDLKKKNLISKFKKRLKINKFDFDAICTKFPNKWL